MNFFADPRPNIYKPKIYSKITKVKVIAFPVRFYSYTDNQVKLKQKPLPSY